MIHLYFGTLLIDMDVCHDNDLFMKLIVFLVNLFWGWLCCFN